MEPHVKHPPTHSVRWLPAAGIIAAIFLLVIASLFWWFHTTKSLVGTVIREAKPFVSTAGRTNLVIMGIGGEGHESPDLTDTIMLVSLGLTSKDIKIISIPRDLWVDTLKAKVNSAYYYGNEKKEKGGLVLAKSAIGEITGQPIHYIAVIDFSGFVQIIDSVGGIDVTVDRPFDDYEYPIPGKETAEPENARYEHLHFDAGLTHMDGTTALKFARSRHASGVEGTDYARGARQQKIILALKDKILTTGTLTNLNTVKSLVDQLVATIKTDISPDLYSSFLQFGLAFQKSHAPLTSTSLTDYVVEPKNKSPYGGQWVILPTKDLIPYVAQFLAK
jgi:polyisoprenyl-teichoic acid--peptidoglycan teichoic acid transferase